MRRSILDVGNHPYDQYDIHYSDKSGIFNRGGEISYYDYYSGEARASAASKSSFRIPKDRVLNRSCFIMYQVALL
jgi:hypothetical protein